MNTDDLKLINKLPEKNRNSYCPVPWREQMIESNGAIRLCCLAQDTVKNDDGTEANVSDNSLDEIWNNRYMQETRQKMLEGIPLDICTPCYEHEANNGYSNRENELEEMMRSRGEFPVDIIVKEKPDYYDVRFGNLCNMKCITCGPQYSSEHYEEYIKIYEDLKVETNNNIIKVDQEMAKLGEYSHVGHVLTTTEMDEIKQNKGNYNWPENDRVFNSILEQITTSDTKKLYITGGEPTLSAGNLKLLTALVDNGQSKNITLWMNTNMTNVNEKFWNLVAQFKHVNVMMSIDGIGDTFDYIRYPGQWKQIEKNISKLINFINNLAPGSNDPNDHQKFELQLSPVIQLLNLLNLEDIIEYFIKIVDPAHCAVTFCPNVLRGPDYYRINNANYNIRQEVNDRIQEKYKDFLYFGTPKLEHFIHILDNTLTYKNNEEYEGEIPLLMNIAYENHLKYQKYRKIDHLDDWFYASMERLI
jgi:MoaA/NifB/PqqE/SkfB family radical SAM enzyme